MSSSDLALACDVRALDALASRLDEYGAGRGRSVLPASAVLVNGVRVAAVVAAAPRPAPVYDGYAGEVLMGVGRKLLAPLLANAERVPLAFVVPVVDL